MHTTSYIIFYMESKYITLFITASSLCIRNSFRLNLAIMFYLQDIHSSYFISNMYRSFPQLNFIHKKSKQSYIAFLKQSNCCFIVETLSHWSSGQWANRLRDPFELRYHYSKLLNILKDTSNIYDGNNNWNLTSPISWPKFIVSSFLVSFHNHI